MTRIQCPKCPWKVGVNPYDIPRGYSVAKHEALQETIAEQGVIDLAGPLRIMSCHDTHEEPCVGWVSNQMGVGNNIPLRIAVSRGRIDMDIEIVGEQHPTLADTLPKT